MICRSPPEAALGFGLRTPPPRTLGRRGVGADAGLLVMGLAALLFSGCATTSGSGLRLTPREEAQVALSRGDSLRAVELLEPEFARHPADLLIARLLAEAHVKAGSGDALLARLAKSDTAVSHYQQGLVRFARAAEATGPAVTEFRRAVELEPNEPEFHYRLGVALLESEQFEEALASLRRATSMAPDRTGWALPLAKALARTGDHKAAVAAIRTVILGNPTPAEVKTAVALMDRLTDPFATFPSAAKPQLEQAMQWLQQADVPQQAIIQLEQILRDYPDLAVVHSLLGLAYDRLDDAGRAVDEFKRAIELAPEDGKAHLYLAELYAARQRPKNAEEHYQKALERNPVLADAWVRVGDLAVDRQDLVGARQAFQVVARLRPDDAAAHGKLALVHQLEGDWPAADKELRLVMDKEPENLEFALRLGVLHAERFTKAKTPAEKEQAAREAAKWLQKVLDAQPENAIASRALEHVKAR
ncbi:MAG: tetratricopeptide repeat protein [Myxococcales bacterium]|nr:tetratricopeptide repeat protein [Myxococcales bacterium]